MEAVVYFGAIAIGDVLEDLPPMVHDAGTEIVTHATAAQGMHRDRASPRSRTTHHRAGGLGQETPERVGNVLTAREPAPAVVPLEQRMCCSQRGIASDQVPVHDEARVVARIILRRPQLQRPAGAVVSHHKQDLRVVDRFGGHGDGVGTLCHPVPLRQLRVAESMEERAGGEQLPEQ